MKPERARGKHYQTVRRLGLEGRGNRHKVKAIFSGQTKRGRSILPSIRFWAHEKKKKTNSPSISCDEPPLCPRGADGLDTLDARLGLDGARIVVERGGGSRRFIFLGSVGFQAGMAWIDFFFTHVDKLASCSDGKMR
jgi:hypothetical protein